MTPRPLPPEAIRALAPTNVGINQFEGGSRKPPLRPLTIRQHNTLARCRREWKVIGWSDERSGPVVRQEPAETLCVVNRDGELVRP